MGSSDRTQKDELIQHLKHIKESPCISEDMVRDVVRYGDHRVLNPDSSMNDLAEEIRLLGEISERFLDGQSPASFGYDAMFDVIRQMKAAYGDEKYYECLRVLMRFLLLVEGKRFCLNCGDLYRPITYSEEVSDTEYPNNEVCSAACSDEYYQQHDGDDSGD